MFLIIIKYKNKTSCGLPGSSSQQVLGVRCRWVHREALRSQQEFTGGHGDVLQIPDHLHLVVLFLQTRNETNVSYSHTDVEDVVWTGSEPAAALT